MSEAPSPVFKCSVCGKESKLEPGQNQLPPHKHQEYPQMDCIGTMGTYLGFASRRPPKWD